MDARNRVELLGGLRVVQDGRVITRFRTNNTANLLAFLAYHLHQSHPRERLIELLWPEIEPGVGRNRLRTTLSFLRHPLEPPGVPANAVLKADRTTVSLNSLAVTTDVMEFETALKRAANADSNDERARHLIEAVELYRGELLPGFYADWVQTEQQRLAERFFLAIRQLIALCVKPDDLDSAIDYALRSVSIDPLREESHVDLIRLFAAEDRLDDALRQYHELERLLQEQLGVAPSAEARELGEMLLRKAGPQSSGAANRTKRPTGKKSVPGVEHEAKARGRQESGETSDARTLHNRRFARSASLPLQFTRFFGREEEIARLAQSLSPLAPLTGKLLTLTGSGGVGKTRLAIEVATRLIEVFTGGVWFVPLADLVASSLIPDALVNALGLTRSRGSEPLEQVVDYLNRCSAPASSHDGEASGETRLPSSSEGQTPEARPMLLVLDNFEHLVADGAQIVGQLRRRVPHLTYLITSRRRLGLSGERAFPVNALPIPELWDRSRGAEDANELGSTPELHRSTPEALLSIPSVQLFVDRAQALRPDFQITLNNAPAVAELCRRLEGLPLAIQLAAARSTTLTPTQMLTQLTTRFDLLVSRKRGTALRHQTLHAALDWSYHLLGPSPQRFFARLSVFRGGWTVEAAAVVCEEPSALDEISRLRDYSLVIAEEGTTTMRFRMLETLREYAAEQLPHEDRAALQRRHAEYLLSLAEEAEPNLQGPDQGVWLDRLEAEHDNLRATLAWSLEEGKWRSEIGLRLAAQLGRFWSVRGYQREGREHLAVLLARPRCVALTPERAEALYAAGKLALDQGAFGDAKELFEQCLSIYRELDDRIGLATSLGDLGNIAYRQGDFARAQALFEESLASHRELSNPSGIANSLCGMGLVAQYQGDNRSAHSLYGESLAIYRDLNNTASTALLLMNLGNVAMQRGEYAAAAELLKESLTMQQQLGNLNASALTLNALGNVAHQRGDFVAARAFHQDCLAINRELGNKHGVAAALANLGIEANRQGDYAAARKLSEDSLAMMREAGAKQGVATVVGNLGDLAEKTGDLQVACAFHRESLALWQELGDREGILYSLRAFGRIALALAQPKRAARLWGAEEVQRDNIGFVFSTIEQQDFDRDLTEAHEALGEEAFAVAWAQGQDMTMEQAIAYALKEEET